MYMSVKKLNIKRKFLTMTLGSPKTAAETFPEVNGFSDGNPRTYMHVNP